MTDKKDRFAIGCAAACANIVSLHDDTVIASDVLRELFDCRKDVYAINDWTEYDRSAFKKIFNDDPTRWTYLKRKGE